MKVERKVSVTPVNIDMTAKVDFGGEVAEILR